MEKATFGSGCFWCTEAIFKRVKGVAAVKSGYTGGHVDSPTYKQVCEGTTGHAEVVQLDFDPQVVSYKELLEVFLQTHDPTTLNRQGNDVGTQYRSAIFYHNLQQKNMALAAIEAANKSGLWEKPLVTEVSELTTFYPAENYHDDYFARNESQPYCAFVIAPKLDKFRKYFAELIQEDKP